MGKAPIKKMILLSDIDGLKNAKWMALYQDVLSKEFEINAYCSLELAGIDPNQTKEEIHQQFINGGLEKASRKLLELETGPTTIIGWSIGGVIGWKAGLNGLQILNLYAVSSTRLRKETHKPLGEMKLIFGENDTNRPNDEWYHEMEIIPRILPNKNHDLYKEPDFITPFSSQVIWASGLIY